MAWNPREQYAASLLEFLAPEVEAAGDFWRAVRVGLIGCDKSQRALLRSLIPVSRGGTLDHPDADADWSALVAEIVQRRAIDMTAIRDLCDRLEPR